MDPFRNSPEDPFQRTIEDSARNEPDRYLNQVAYDPTDYKAPRIAATWVAIDKLGARPVHSALDVAKATGAAYGAINAALRQRDGFGYLDPSTEAALARTVAWAYNRAPSKPFGLVVAGPTAPARGVRVKPVRPFGVEVGSRPELTHGKLWRVFAVSLYGPLTDGWLPFGWEAPLSARVRAAEVDTIESALAQQRIEAFTDPLGYVTGFIESTVRTFERHQPTDAPKLAILISMGRRDQEVPYNGLLQDRRGESLASHVGWPEAARRAARGLVPTVEVAHQEYEEQLLSDLEYRSSDGLLIRPDRIMPWLKEAALRSELSYLPSEPGSVPSALATGVLIDRRARRAVGKLIVAAPTEAPARLFAIPNELDAHGIASTPPSLTAEDRGAIERVITGWAAQNEFTGSCRRRSFYGWSWFGSSSNNIDAIELAWRRGACIRFWQIDFTPEGPVNV